MQIQEQFASLVACSAALSLFASPSMAQAPADASLTTVRQALTAADPPPNTRLDTTTTCAASDWKKDQNGQNHVTEILNPSDSTTLKSFALYFSPGAGQPVYPVQWSWAANRSGNPVTVELTAERVTLHIHGPSHLHGMWNARLSPPAWQPYTEGYWRVITCR